jgi:HEAT repeat protein
MKMDIQNKLTEIECISTQASLLLTRIHELTLDKNDEIRFRAIECLDQIGIQEVLTRIRDSLKDTDELVRVTCLEILGEMQDDHSSEEIENLLNDESSLVRGAAAIALGGIGNVKYVEKLLSRLLTEEDDEVRIPIYAALYILEQESYLENLLEGLTNEYYRVRCATANLLVTVSNRHNIVKILEALSIALQKEESLAASSSIKSAINYLQDDSA